VADLSAGEEKVPDIPRHLVNVDQLASRRRTVSGACGPLALRKSLVAEAVLDAGQHAMVRIGATFFRIPQVVRDEFQQQRFRRRPGQGVAGGRQRPGLQMGEVGGQRPQRVVAHAGVDKMAERFDVLVGQQLGELFAAVDRQHCGDRIKFAGAPFDRT
jgi:hypothetical protein